MTWTRRSRAWQVRAAVISSKAAAAGSCNGRPVSKGRACMRAATRLPAEGRVSARARVELTGFALLCCAGAEIPTPYATQLELASFPQVEDIIKATKKMLNK